MSLILSWVLFPLVLAAIGAGWGVIVERAAGTRVNDALLLPLGLAAALVVAGTLTAFNGTAAGAAPVVVAGAAIALLLAWPGGRLHRWPMVAAVAVLLVYGAPVLLSGQATFTGYVKLDDTATWFNVMDHLMSHGRSVSGEPPSTYTLVYVGDVGPSYPLGGFVLPGVARWLVRADIAWVFQPYLACCAAALAMCLHALLEPVIASPRRRAALSFIGAQPALLYGYSLWGGIKELTAAFLLAVGMALGAEIVRERPLHRRKLLPLAIATGALIQVLGPGAGGWIAPALVLIATAWLWRSGQRRLRSSVTSLAWLAGATAALVIPVWVVLSSFLSGGLAAGLFSSGQSLETRLGNLIHPLSVFQLAGVWPVEDFRRTPPALPSALFIALVILMAAAAIWTSVRARRFGVPLYATVALTGCAILYLSGATPWVTGKALAISSPALLTGALAGSGILWSRKQGHRWLRVLGALLTAALAGGVIWSNVLAYHDATLAPRPRLAELQHIGELVAGEGPTFLNEYEVYADRHFLRAGAPVEPAEYRYAILPLRSGIYLTKAGAADLDSFPLSTLEPYRSIVTRRSPAESRPPSAYQLVWQGRYYQLWQLAAQPQARILEHIPLGESNTYPYCGQAQNGPGQPVCSISPVATPPCSQIQNLAARASAEHASLLAYQRPEPVVARGDQTLWPARWIHGRAEHTLVPTAPGHAVSHIALATAQRYELWLDGSFTRGFEVSVDGQTEGRVKDQLSSFSGGYIHLADVFLESGVHTFTLTYPQSDLTPGSGDNELTSLDAIVLQPQQSPTTELISVSPREATILCGRPLDWIEIVGSA